MQPLTRQGGIVAGSRPRGPSRAGLTRKSLKLAICDAPSELDEVDVPKPFAIIEKGNDLGGDPDQEETFFPGQCVS